MMSKDLGILKMKQKLNFDIQKYLVHWNTREVIQEKKTK